MFDKESQKDTTRYMYDMDTKLFIIKEIFDDYEYKYSNNGLNGIFINHKNDKKYTWVAKDDMFQNKEFNIEFFSDKNIRIENPTETIESIHAIISNIEGIYLPHKLFTEVSNLRKRLGTDTFKVKDVIFLLNQWKCCAININTRTYKNRPLSRLEREALRYNIKSNHINEKVEEIKFLNTIYLDKIDITKYWEYKVGGISYSNCESILIVDIYKDYNNGD